MVDRVRPLVTVGSYPAVLGLGFLLYGVLVDMAVPVNLAAYAAVVVGAVFITCHEIWVPYRAAWKPSRSDIGSDAMFMLVVQGALPQLLAITVVIELAELLQRSGNALEGFWPHAWPIAVQAALMLAAADLLRYWLHRAFHKYKLMWRFHAVHHSPHRLYWLNVGRFHPIEKAIQYAFDTLPFALLGVVPEVLAAYYVFYALNGFFQHSNCDVRLGPLNWIVAGPELHRWHHSELPAESDHNFGNNLIIWDVLFRTRFLPDRGVGPLGLLNRNYPTGFLAQMKTPFIRGLEGG